MASKEKVVPPSRVTITTCLNCKALHVGVNDCPLCGYESGTVDGYVRASEIAEKEQEIERLKNDLALASSIGRGIEAENKQYRGELAALRANQAAEVAKAEQAVWERAIEIAGTTMLDFDEALTVNRSKIVRALKRAARTKEATDAK